MRRVLALTGIVACAGLAACTSMHSSEQLHDTRMRMRHGMLINPSPTNYGTKAAMQEEHEETSVPARQGSTMSSFKPTNWTAGNYASRQMVNAPAHPQPAATSGNMTP